MFSFAAESADKNTLIGRDLLSRVDRICYPKVRRNEEIVINFVEALQAQFVTRQHDSVVREAKVLGPSQILRGAHIMHGGSAYEGLTVTEKTDFDIILVLNKPYTIDQFTVSRDPSSKFFCLKRKDTGRFLNSQELQRELFDKLVACLYQLGPVRGVRSMTYNRGLAALTLTLKTNHGVDISVDLAPQIAVRQWGGCPDLTNRHSLPSALQNYIRTLEANVSPVYFFSLSVPDHHNNQQHLCNISFSMLEKAFLRSDPGVRDMVRLVKLVGEACYWKTKYSLKSFHIKRVAVKHYDDLKGKPLWEGYKALMSHMWRELSSNTIDGFFVSEQPIYKKPKLVQEFRNALAVAINEWSAEEVRRKVEQNLQLF